MSSTPPHIKRQLQIGLILALVIGLYLALAAFVLREQKDSRVNFQACPLCGQGVEK
jgi:hypothetical protein